MKINKKGFTLIELLVVIAIIGLLSTMAVVSLNSARMKSRDARRLSDVKQLSTMMSLASTNSNEPIMCDTSDGGAAAACSANRLTMAVSAPADLVAEFDKFHDPSIPQADWDDIAQACGTVTTEPCNYAFKGMTSVSSSTINFYLEAGTGDLAKGIHWINSDGVFDQ